MTSAFFSSQCYMCGISSRDHAAAPFPPLTVVDYRGGWDHTWAIYHPIIPCMVKIDCEYDPNRPDFSTFLCTTGDECASWEHFS